MYCCSIASTLLHHFKKKCLHSGIRDPVSYADGCFMDAAHCFDVIDWLLTATPVNRTTHHVRTLHANWPARAKINVTKTDYTTAIPQTFLYVSASVFTAPSLLHFQKQKLCCLLVSFPPRRFLSLTFRLAVHLFDDTLAFGRAATWFLRTPLVPNPIAGGPRVKDC